MRGILTYHSIDPSASPISVSEASFKNHAEWLGSGAVRIVPLERLLDEPPESDAVALTFDDGFENFAAAAWPVLRERGLPVTLFVATDHVGGTNRWPGDDGEGIPELPLLDWDALARLREEGVTIGSHSRSHRDLRTLEPGELADELEQAARAIDERTGARPTTFAYPYGLLDDGVARAVGERYALACTTELRVLGRREDPHRLPRLDAYYLQRPGTLEHWGTARFRAWLKLRAAGRRARSTLLR